MLARADITKGIYLRLRTPRLGKPAGLIGIVYAVGTDQADEWYFQLRYLNSPPGTRTRAGSHWSLNLHETDLEHLDRIDTWDQVQKLLRGSAPPRKPKTEEMKLPAYLTGEGHPDQLRLFEDF
ncbi:MAG: hypothetical protein OEU99_16105 [Nitrospira sp.]|nr:hypothetical protein [Nitrospira sp.]